jgi:nucleoside-diphosphate-sugar epimerase
MGYRLVSGEARISRRPLGLSFFPSIINPAKAINELGWKPRHVGFVEEIDIYYKAWAAHK